MRKGIRMGTKRSRGKQPPPLWTILTCLTWVHIGDARGGATEESNMKRLTIYLAVFAVLLYAGSMPAFAQHGPGGGGPSSGAGPGGGRPSGMGGGADSGMGPGMGSGMGHGASGTAGPSSGPNSGPNSQQQSGRKSVSDLLTQNTKLASQISNLTGTDAQTACSGFKNLGQCVAAAHVSKNLGIDFSALKGKVTGSGSEKLGKAIHDLNPNVDSKSETKKGQQQAHADMNSAS